jgi:hypothetical protein
MNNRRCCAGQRSVAVLSIWIVASTAATQDELPADGAANARLRRAQEYVGALDVRLATGGDLVSRIDHPLLTYGDPARDSTDGTLWAWGKEGRPLVMMESFRNANGSRSNAISLTSTEMVIMKTPASGAWHPQRTHIEPAPLAGAPAPDEKETVRLRQLRDQARRFTGHEFWNPENSRYEFRLLVQPVYRYRDERQAILDGAVFVLAYESNPEVLLLIEALRPAADKGQWQYVLARLGSAELHVELDGQEVWKQDRTPGVVGKPTDPYWLMMTAAEPTPAPISK